MRAIAATGVIFGVLLASGCAYLTAHYTTPPETTPGVSLDSPRVQQIALARASNELFSIFPARPGTKRCTIPAGGVRGSRLHGTCETRVRRGATHEPSVIVTFTETWWVPPCPPGAFCPIMRPLRHTWTVVEAQLPGSHLHVVATRQSGQTAPQYYK